MDKRCFRFLDNILEMDKIVPHKFAEVVPSNLNKTCPRVDAVSAPDAACPSLLMYYTRTGYKTYPQYVVAAVQF